MTGRRERRPASRHGTGYGYRTDWPIETLVCLGCRRTATGTLPTFGRAGWDWWTGPGQAVRRKELCPDCAKDAAKRARHGFPARSG
jgi:hypothetical protein